MAAFEKLIELNPDTAGAHYYIALMLLVQGQTEAAIERIQLENLDGFKYTGLTIIHDALGDKTASDAALAILNELGVDWAYQRVMVYAMRGEIDKAFKWLETAIEIRDRGLIMSLCDPMVDNLRDDLRFADVLRRLNRTAVRERCVVGALLAARKDVLVGAALAAQAQLLQAEIAFQIHGQPRHGCGLIAV